MISKDQYFKVRKERQEWLGERYFKFNNDSDKIIQVCMSAGETKKGKTNTFGIYLIHRMTFLSNYLMQKYVVECKKEEYLKIFEQTVNYLK